MQAISHSRPRPAPEFIDVGEGADRRAIAVLRRAGAGPCVTWLGGFRSDMRATKAEALDAFAAREGRAFLRLDYSGHGESGGRFEEGTISRWLEETLAVIRRFAGPAPVLVGSSMGGWLALLAARALQGSPEAPSGLVLIAPAVDFTEALMWASFPKEVRAAIESHGVWHRPSAYADTPTPITRGLIEDGRRHLLLGAPLALGCPVRILQGMEDPDVPFAHALLLLDHLAQDDATLTLIKDGDHRLSRPQDLERLIAAVSTIGADGGQVGA